MSRAGAGSFGDWDEHGRGVLDRLDDLTGQIKELRHKANNLDLTITGHIKVCEMKSKNDEQFKESSSRAILALKAELSSERTQDLAAINSQLKALGLTVSQKDKSIMKLLWSGVIAWAGSATMALFWALGKLLHLI